MEEELKREEIDAEENLEESSSVDTPNEEEATPEESSNVNALGALGDVAKEKAKTAVLAFISKNPWVIGAIVGIVFLFIMFMYVSMIFSDGSWGNSSSGYYASKNTCNDVSVFSSEYTSNVTVSLEEYLQGVVLAEVGIFNDEEIFKVFMVAVRTYSLRHFESSGACSIAGNATKQAYRPTSQATSEQKEMLRRAYNETMGTVVTDGNGNLLLTQYDAFCWNIRNATSYNMAQQGQVIPTSWVDLNVPNQHRNCKCSKNLSEEDIVEDFCYGTSSSGSKFYVNGGHGNGMSQYGVKYLVETGETWENVLAYYYNGGELSNIYGSGEFGKYPLTVTNSDTEKLNEPLETFLLKNGTSIEALNSSLYASVREAGIGTRAAVVRVIEESTLAIEQKYKIRFPYTYGGHHGYPEDYSVPNQDYNYKTSYGFNPNWGYRFPSAVWVDGTGPYELYGPDCSGYIAWVIYNAGYNYSVGDSTSWWRNANAKSIADFRGQPGDLIGWNGHVMFILGINDQEGLYYVAHASDGATGVKVSTYKMGANTNETVRVVDMTSYYENASNVVDDYPLG